MSSPNRLAQDLECLSKGEALGTQGRVFRHTNGGSPSLIQAKVIQMWQKLSPRQVQGDSQAECASFRWCHVLSLQNHPQLGSR